MSIDFSKIKKITIPEGNVKKIEDANGNTLWKGSVMVSASVVNATVTGTGEYDSGATYTVTITANNGYYFSSYTNGGVGSDVISVNNVNYYKTLTYTGIANNNISIAATATAYYTFKYGDNNTWITGSLTFSNNQTYSFDGTIDSTIANVYYNGNLTINAVYHSRKIYASYNKDDRIITSYSGATSSSALSNWLGDGTAYDTVTCSKTINNTDYTFTVTAVDSAAGKIINNSGNSITIKNTSSNKTSTLSSGSNATYYCEYSTKANNTITISNPSSAYNYSGDGSFSFGDSSSSPTTRTVSRSVKSYTLTYSRGSNVQSIVIKRISSPYAGVTGYIYNTGTTIYYGDVLSVSATANSYYVIDTTSYSSSYTVTGNISFTVKAKFDTNPNIYPESYTGQGNMFSPLYVNFKNDSQYKITITQVVCYSGGAANVNVTINPGDSSYHTSTGGNSSSDTVKQITWYYTDKGSSNTYIKYF